MIDATYNMMLDTGFWILDEIRNFFTSLISLIFRKGSYNKLLIFPGTVNRQVFIPAKEGISASLQQATSIQQRASLHLRQKN